ncbi:MAG: hypothetical protein DGJ47_000308 [Rickettsiaceae bacterium]
MPQFDITTFSSQLFWLFFIFSVLYFVIHKYIAPRIELVISSRDKYLESNVNMAQEYNDKLKSLEAYKEQTLEEINSQISELQEMAMKVFSQQHQENMDEIAQKMQKKRQKNTDNIAQYVNNFHKSESQYCLSLAAMIIEKITKKPADSKALEQIYQK